jgi:hypothetical protein
MARPDDEFCCQPATPSLERVLVAMEAERMHDPSRVSQESVERVRARLVRLNEDIAALRTNQAPSADLEREIWRRKRQAALADLSGKRDLLWDTSGVRLTVGFLGSPTPTLRARILSHMNAWSETANVEFVESSDHPVVRIAFNDEESDPLGLGKFWSLVGRDVLAAAPDEPTMNLEGLEEDSSEAKFKRYVRHEAGHTLGFEHEHLRRELVELLIPERVMEKYTSVYAWTEERVRAEMLTPLEEESILGTTPADPQSIMCYQIEPFLTTNNRLIPGGKDITDKDRAFAATCYPKPRQ